MAFIAMLGITFGGVAVASIPDGNGVVHACYHNSNGSVRIIDSTSASCGNNESAISWSQVGPTGPTGADGADGADGVSGYEIIERVWSSRTSDTFYTSFADCSEGKQVIGGGYRLLTLPHTANQADFAVVRDGPSSEQTSWQVHYTWFNAATDYNISVYAICVNV
jgi:hypothetical protein